MSTPNNPNPLRMLPPESGIRVRMYNPGFGDCFLLAFRADGGGARYLLIDCGVHHQYKDLNARQARLKLLGEDLLAATDGHLHVIAITHEHTDHLYGFKYARSEFENFEIDDLWLAWTEDPHDSAAQALKKLYGMRIKALTAAAERLQLAGDPLAATIRGLPDYAFADALAAVPGGNAEQLAFLRAQSKKQPERAEDYRQPGEAPLTLPGVSGVRIYVLGPPKEAEWIRSLERANELYPEMAEMDATLAFAAAALAATGVDSLGEGERELFERSLPFDHAYIIPRSALEEGAKMPINPSYQQFFHKAYGFSDRGGQGPAWRRIETDWLRLTEKLALNIDKKTNNTSLVLAIELIQTHKVLLFVGDAQVGNWLSWHREGLSWPAEHADEPPVTAETLLRRTVLYKTGHHGSHNATLKEKGLEMMINPDLVAMIPVDQQWAKDAMQWEHPAEKLYERLLEKTRGRVIRSDRIPTGDQPPPIPAETTEDEWGAFLAQLDWDRSPEKLWIQYTVTT